MTDKLSPTVTDDAVEAALDAWEATAGTRRDMMRNALNAAMHSLSASGDVEHERKKAFDAAQLDKNCSEEFCFDAGWDARAALTASGNSDVADYLREQEKRPCNQAYLEATGRAGNGGAVSDDLIRLREAMERERRQWFCSGQDCSEYDHGRDEGFEKALEAFDRALLNEGERS